MGAAALALEDIVIDFSVGLAGRIAPFISLPPKTRAEDEKFPFFDHSIILLQEKEQKKKDMKKQEEKEDKKKDIVEEEFSVFDILKIQLNDDVRYQLAGENEKYVIFSDEEKKNQYFIESSGFYQTKETLQYAFGLNDEQYISAFERALLKYDTYLKRPEFKDPYVWDYFIHIPAFARVEKVSQDVLGEGVLGTCEPGLGRIRVLNSLYSTSFMEVLIHEAMHLHQPWASEGEVRRMTSERMDQLGLEKTFHK